MKKFLSSAALVIAGWLGTVGLQAAPTQPVIPGTTFNVAKAPFNAQGDGTTDNTTSIQNAIITASASGGGTVEIPAPGTYLCGPLTLSSRINLQVDAGAVLTMLPLNEYPGGTTDPANFISGSHLQDIEISGFGAINGQGAPWWPFASVSGANRPSMISLNDCDRILIQNITLSNSPMFHIAIGGTSGNTTVSNITVRAPSSEDPVTPSHNTDACDVSGTNILVENCNISTGDDDFTCGGGTSGVLLTNNTYGNGHGVSIGSYTDGGVSNITVVNCTFNGTDNGVRIKSDNDRGGLVQNISYLNLSMTNVGIPIQLYAYYNEVGTPNNVTPAEAAGEPVAAVTGLTPVYSNIIYSNITATSTSGNPVGIVWARTEMPAANIVFDNVTLAGDRNFCLYNVSGAQFINCNFNVSSNDSTFAVYNAGITLTNQPPATNQVSLTGLPGNLNSLALFNTLATMTDATALGDTPIVLEDGILSVTNQLALASNSVVSFYLGSSSNAATVEAYSDLTLNSTLNFYAGNGFNPQTYYLIFTYNGALSGTPVLGAMPYGYVASLISSPGLVISPGWVFVVFKPIPVITNINFTPNTLSFSGTNGTADSSYTVLASTNLTLPTTDWSPVLTQQFNSFGNFNFTLTPGTNGPQKFFQLEVP